MRARARVCINNRRGRTKVKSQDRNVANDPAQSITIDNTIDVYITRGGITRALMKWFGSVTRACVKPTARFRASRSSLPRVVLLFTVGRPSRVVVNNATTAYSRSPVRFSEPSERLNPFE